MTAAREGKVDMVQLFLDRKVDANAEDGEAFVAAVGNKKFDVADLLLLKGGDVNAQGGKALRHAAYVDEKETVEFLFNRGANPNAHDRRETALTEAIRAGSSDMVKLLMRNGADHAALQGAAWESAKTSYNNKKKMLRALVEGAREGIAHLQDIKLAEFSETFGKKALQLRRPCATQKAHRATQAC